MKKSLFFCFSFLLVWGGSFEQARSFTDPAQMYNRLLLQKTNSISRIGNYRVQGTPFLFGGKLAGTLFVHTVNPASVLIGYNTHKQTVEYAQSLNDDYLKPTLEVDSFILNKNPSLKLEDDLKFINGSIINGPKKGFYQEVCGGDKYVLYKFYSSVLGIVSTNYIEADLRQFNLDYEYYYLERGIKKVREVKQNLGFVKKEFNNAEANSAVTNEDFKYSPELALIKVFGVLNGVQ